MINYDTKKTKSISSNDDLDAKDCNEYDDDEILEWPTCIGFHTYSEPPDEESQNFLT